MLKDELTEERIKRIEEIVAKHEKRILLLEGKSTTHTSPKEKTWYKPGSTIEKIVNLRIEGFFNSEHTIAEIINEFKTRDYHLKASDLTLPLRRIVRKGLLKKTKKRADGTTSGKWLYVKV
ncbi:MAG: hypothetical protein NT157_02355 [Candidatus Micrarchaeota archaeon]|nr:hypothetical protein [Candidatus Micrarchaeota archaeon]